jgi:hypothetical protein
MVDKIDLNFQSTQRQHRILPEDSFGDWKWREALAELMVPLIGSLYRDGVNLMIYGKSLVNESPVSIMKCTDSLVKLIIMSLVNLKHIL